MLATQEILPIKHVSKKGRIGPVLLARIFILLLIGLGNSIASATTPKILVYTRTLGYDHATRIVADSVLRVLGLANGFDIDTTQDPTFFTDAKLAQYKTVCFINVTGDPVLNDSQKVAFQRFIRAGNGFVGMHAATDCGYSWPWYGKLTGAWFMGHPYNIKQGKIIVVDKNHPSTNFIVGDTLTRTDEWYFWYLNGESKEDPATNSNLHVLLKLNDASLDPQFPFHEHPFAWYQDYDGGRSWYSGFGHSPEYFKDPFIQKHLLGGILYAAGISPTNIDRNPRNTSTKQCLSFPNSITVYNLLGKRICSVSQENGNMPSFWNHKDGNGDSVIKGVYILKSNFGAYSTISKIALR